MVVPRDIDGATYYHFVEIELDIEVFSINDKDLLRLELKSELVVLQGKILFAQTMGYICIPDF